MKKITFILVFLLAVSFPLLSVFAAWAEPTKAPTEGNVDAPINVSDKAQTKKGSLVIEGVLSTLNGLLVGTTVVDLKGLKARVVGNIGATEYCDSNGLNCKPITAMGTGLPTGTANQTLRNNGTGWVASNALLNNDVNVGIGVAPLFRLHVQDGANGPTGYFKNTNGAGGYAAAVEGESVNSGAASGAIGYLGGYDSGSSLWYGVKGENATAGSPAILGKASNGAYAGYFEGGAVKIGTTKIQGGSDGQLWVANDVCIDGGPANGRCLSSVTVLPGGDNLGNHIAAKDLNMGTNGIVLGGIFRNTWPTAKELSCVSRPGNQVGSIQYGTDLAATANCLSGETLTGGGFASNGPGCGVYYSAKTSTTEWTAKCMLVGTLGAELKLQAYATCCKVQ